MKKLNTLILILTLSFLTGCSMLKDKICDDPLTEYEKPLLELNKLDPIEPKKDEFIIITEKIKIETKINKSIT